MTQPTPKLQDCLLISRVEQDMNECKLLCIPCADLPKNALKWAMKHHRVSPSEDNPGIFHWMTSVRDGKSKWSTRDNEACTALLLFLDGGYDEQDNEVEGRQAHYESKTFRGPAKYNPDQQRIVHMLVLDGMIYC